MARNVNEGDLACTWQIGPGIAQLDRQSPPMLLLEPVRLAPGESANQRRLAMVHVARRDDDMH
jgi:hypothetical protein